MDALRGQQKNQTVKKGYTIVVFLSTEYGDQEVFSQTVNAESIREALRLVNSAVSNL
jgi:hypothetical protein